MRKKTGLTKILRRAAALALSTVLAVGCILPVGASAPDESNSYGEYIQKIVLYQMLGDSDAGLHYFDQLVQQDTGDLSAYLARAQMRQMAGDIAGARQDCDYAIGHLTADPSENAETRLYGYAIRSVVDFFQGNQAQYLADEQSHQEITGSIFDMMRMGSDPESAQEWQAARAKADADLKELRVWYNNGAPAKNFQTEHARVQGGIGDNTIQIQEEWSEESIDTTYDTTFHLSQPVRNITRQIPSASEFSYAVLEQNNNENGSVAYFVPVGTIVTMEQMFQSGKSRAKTYNAFRAEDMTGNTVFDGESMTVEAGKIYRLDYASNDSITVYFIAI